MGAKDYKKKYGFVMKTPLSAKSLTKARSKAVNKKGLPEELKQYLESRWQSKAKEAKPATAELVTVNKPNKNKRHKKKANSGPKAQSH
jgi:hypothetical protein